MKERVYNTQFDNQVSAEFNVYQGESNIIRENILLGSFAMYDIPAAPIGKQKLKVCFNIDASGIVNVSAEVISTVSYDIYLCNGNEKVEDLILLHVTPVSLGIRLDDIPAAPVGEQKLKV
ncbi:heat shock cognate 70 kDa protein-like protein [Tanacetum coccineum]|uniref:Heat shock cognate 70 kDa protein-like protein n=1 Tax=Tanacetum coccineum TaxID=301880 RepID=A0ABQ5GSK9_9ASTR